jgi:hypothetical protein
MLKICKSNDMINNYWNLSLVFLLVIGFSLPYNGVCQNSAMLHGKVINKKTQEGIHCLEVVIFPGKDTLVTVTNEDGAYQLNHVPKGTYDVLFQDVNYGKKILKDVDFNQDTVRKNVQISDKVPSSWRWCPGTPSLESPSSHFSIHDLTGNVKFEGERLQRQLK